MAYIEPFAALERGTRGDTNGSPLSRGVSGLHRNGCRQGRQRSAFYRYVALLGKAVPTRHCAGFSTSKIVTERVAALAWEVLYDAGCVLSLRT